MATQFVNKTYVLTIELNHKEALWLNGVMQNPLHGQSPDQEAQEDSEMRKTFFDATVSAQIK